MNKGIISMFGRSYAQVGNSDQDFLIKTKGKVKIQWGNKFIDIIKNGKLNVDTDFIFEADSKDDIGVKDGIYVINDLVYLKIGESLINLVGEIGTTYVSFMGEQETTSEQKYTALQNIGFIYSDLNSISDNSLKNGIIYIESDQKLYIVQEGQLSEFKIDLPNPVTEQFVIAKSDSAKGALLIKGQGIDNSLAFENLFIYNDFGTSYIESDSSIYFKVGSLNKIAVENNNVTFYDPVISKMFQSKGASEDSGFRLYINEDGSTLEIDNLIVRNSDSSQSSSQSVVPVEWFSKNNIIQNIDISVQDSTVEREDNEEEDEEEGGEYEEDEEDEEDDSGGGIEYSPSEEDEYSGTKITLLYQNEYQVGDLIYVYTILKDCPDSEEQEERDEDEGGEGYDEDEGDDEESNKGDDEEGDEEGSAELPSTDESQTSTLFKVPLVVIQLDREDKYVIYVEIDEDTKKNLEQLGITESEILEGMIGQTTYLIGSKDSSKTILRRSESGLDLVKSSSFQEESDISSIQSRFGNLSELELKETNNNEEVDVTGYGVYSEQAYFKKAKYATPYDLPEDDDSSSFASTEWVRKITGISQPLLPIGTIIAYHGDSIPDGWAICDGQNGTPNLIGKFIMADVSEKEGDEITITSLNTQIPTEVSTVKISPVYYSLIFIMKIQ